MATYIRGRLHEVGWPSNLGWLGLPGSRHVKKKQQKNNFYFTIRANLTTPVTWDPGIAMQLVTTMVNWILILTNLNIRKRDI